MEFYAQQFIIGLSLGSILLLVALGLAIIYGAMGVINMAHGEFIMLGAYGGWLCGAVLGLPLIANVVLIFLATALIGAAIERGIIRHLYHRPLDTILATWGIGIVIQQLVRLSAGSGLRYVPMPDFVSQSVSIGGLDIPAYRIFILFAVIVMFAVTWVIFNRTTAGMKLRAVVQNPEVASAFGINASRVRTATFAYGAGLAGVAGALVAPLKSVSPGMGTSYVIDAFFVVVLGGIQSLFGTAASSLLLGQATGALAYWQNDTIAKALVLIIILVLVRYRPQGLFAARIRS